MSNLMFITQLPIMGFFGFVVLILFIVSIIFYLLGKKRADGAMKFKTSELISTNALGLLALLLGFSFSIAVERHERRRVIAVEEANAIGTAYLRSSVVNFRDPALVKALFKKYVNLRITAHSGDNAREMLKDLEPVQKDIWNQLRLVAVKDRGELESAYMSSLNEMFDVANSRNYALLKMLPPSFYILIISLCSVAIGLIAFDRGINRDANHMRSFVLICLFGLVLTFIYDLDHFHMGLVKLNQDAIIQVGRMIDGT